MSAPDKNFIRKAFDSITPRYDLLNQILSFGMSELWRRRSAEIVLGDPVFMPESILDLGCGTGKFLECFLHKKAWKNAVGVDFSATMLEKARRTVQENVLWLQEDFDRLPFLGSSFDLVISGFTLRSVQELSGFLNHVYMILTPGGKAVFLDLTRPKSFWARIFFYPYLKFILPFLGWMISGKGTAYQFLSRSVEHFQEPERTLQEMAQAGFRNCCSKSFAFGAATLMIGQK